ncbi:MAG: pectinesterase family protein [Pseudomonadota bacterium]
MHRRAVLLLALWSASMAPAAASPVADRIWPPGGALAVHVDEVLRLNFDAPPELGAAGSVRIYRKQGDLLVDTVLVAGDVEQLGYAGMAQVRLLNNPAIAIDGNTASIRLHSDKLRYGTEYYVVVDDGVLAGATLGGAPFHGIAKPMAWSFTTKAEAPRSADVTVDDDGPADFRTVQGALNYVMQNVARDSAATITVKDGHYREMLYLRGKDKLTIRGESRDGVVIEFDNNDGINPGTGASTVPGAGTVKGGRALFLVEDADLLTLDTLTLHNTHLKTGKGDQAESLYFNSPFRLIARNVTFLSRQDTLLVNGYSWFYNCLVAGDVDFIWGYANVALFENSEIRSIVDNTNASKGGYVLQARSRSPTDLGYVFFNSRLTSEPGVPSGKTYLARSSGRNTVYDQVAFINTEIGAHIAADGWHIKPPPAPAIATATTGWREYNSKARAGTHVAGYSYQLTSEEYRATYISRARIFAAYNQLGWNPQP